jgi:hypothetical protein
MSTQPASERLALIRQNLAEVLNQEIIEKIVAEGGHPKIYWGAYCRIELLPHAAHLTTGRAHTDDSGI